MNAVLVIRYRKLKWNVEWCLFENPVALQVNTRYYSRWFISAVLLHRWNGQKPSLHLHRPAHLPNLVMFFVLPANTGEVQTHTDAHAHSGSPRLVVAPPQTRLSWLAAGAT